MGFELAIFTHNLGTLEISSALVMAASWQRTKAKGKRRGFTSSCLIRASNRGAMGVIVWLINFISHLCATLLESYWEGKTDQRQVPALMGLPSDPKSTLNPSRKAQIL